ncbi:hypothetical protein [Desmospora profundinema]|uniref:Sarcosine oxidase delta subunit n=1 Tax=Desmospora profundinema TaxID=1571184 RepID=A0ABU1INJ8_9BACL|nr:hypothetical protein [Desmospora profundinema]MDR6226313.1 sarcosine oxidase delta subunit [Desmospora profundinema]
MDHITGCPVCNGFDLLEVTCPHCGEMLEDRGRFFDLLADYSPYRPIDDLKKSDGLVDWVTNQCPHYLYCRHCGHDEHRMVQEHPL